ncbi:TetR/AcrR family transcriptional regulator [Patulibacter brassicae]|uniref:TetR/AcrR family transcriptional regulator n=1 Tax=Patulibacter brassicae TaxID=1705717 RepID=A0ABU4VJ90_9ACTN|nr:TetR/AcrR family transcriptional regulator [Patulibacter brassicae]MDX8151485.1 TetR/AcrR family transcriptional regulator [Patulibacter brassicae]
MPGPDVATENLTGDAAAEDPTRDRILDAALEQFMAIGIRRASVGDIAKRAGVGRMTVYRRFPQRDELITAAVMREARRELEEIGRPLGAIEDPDERLVELLVRTIRAVVAQPLLARLRETEPEDVALRVTSGSEPLVTLGRDFMQTYLEGEIAAGRMREQDAATSAELLARITFSLFAAPDSVLPLDDEAALRTVVGAHLAPIVTGRPITTA